VRAGLVTGPRRLELVEMPEPSPVPGTAVVAISRCGICGTDVHGYLGPAPYNPAICGHEWVGSVVAVGDGVQRVHEGDRVVGAVAAPCGDCPECRRGREPYCRRAFAGMVGVDPLAPPHGGFAARLAVDAARLVVVDAPLTDEQAALVEPTAVAWHAIARTPIREGEVVAVQGCGPIGLLALQCARAAGAAHVIAIEPDAERGAIAGRLGAHQAVAPGDAADVLPADGVDLVLECAGVPATVQQAVDLVRRGGRVNLVGLASGPATIAPGSWLVKEVTVVASLGYQHHEFAEVIGLLDDGEVRVEPLLDRTVGLDDLAATFATLADEPTAWLKVLVDPTR
jgi:(R,R)-butanediol dehydrogenase/meso-butanediol dehydrogenase/diacetyl reductase